MLKAFDDGEDAKHWGTPAERGRFKLISKKKKEKEMADAAAKAAVSPKVSTTTQDPSTLAINSMAATRPNPSTLAGNNKAVTGETGSG